jgi:hypothetical protein
MAGPMEVRKILTLIFFYVYQPNYFLVGKRTTNENHIFDQCMTSLGILASEVDLFLPEA